jgi:DnaJ homolog subfamily C member 19
LLKIAIFLAIGCLIFRWAFGQWPWQGLSIGSRSGASQEVFRARKLLGVEAKASREEIITAHRQLVAIIHPDRGGSDEAMKEANAARDLLLTKLPDREN